MNTLRTFFVIVLLAMPSAAIPSQASPAAASRISGYAYLLGTWHCSFTVGPTRGTYTTAWSETLGGQWLRQTIDQPPTQRSMMKGGYGSAEPGFQATFLVGYDSRRSSFVRFGALSTGQYFAMRMKPRGNDGWTWTYVSFFRNRTVSKPDATLERTSARSYRIDGPTYADDVTHALVTEHHQCTKA